MIKYSTFIEAVGTFAGELRFLAKAVGDDETRFFMLDIEIESLGKNKGFRAIATDGKRMHIVEPLSELAVDLGISAGRWHVVSSKPSKTQIAKLESDRGKFPNWKKVMPEGDPKWTGEFYGLPIRSRYNLPTGSVSLAKMLRAFPEPTAFNLQYLIDLGSSLDPWIVQWWATNKGVKFISNNKTALIMPMLVD